MRRWEMVTVMEPPKSQSQQAAVTRVQAQAVPHPQQGSEEAQRDEEQFARQMIQQYYS